MIGYIDGRFKMARWGRAVVIALVTLMAVAAYGQDKPPVEPDPSTPLGAAVKLFMAISEGDRDAVADALHADSDEQRELCDALANFIVAGKKLGDAAREQFGKAGEAIGRGMMDPGDLNRLYDAKVFETGDRAVITVEDQPRPMTFRRSQGKWRLVVTDFSGASQENLPQQIKLVKEMASALAQSADEVKQGKYSTAADAENAIQQRLHAIMVENYRPARDEKEQDR